MEGEIMKKLLIIILGAFILVGCSDTTNTPSRKVEDYLGKYQRMDDDVLTQLDVILDNDTTMDKDQKKDYKSLLIKQYQNLSYKITDERVEDEKAEVDVEVEVYDYQSSIVKSKNYFEEHKDEFMKEVEEDVDEAKAYIKYKIEELKKVGDKTSYDITFNLTKEDGQWVVSDLSDTDRKKIHGLY